MTAVTATPHTTVEVDRLFDDGGAALLELAERFGAYGMYSQEHVAMHHSGLFEDHRMPIATGVSWFHDCDGGEFTYWPDGADGPARQHTVRRNTAVVLDADSVFHGVDRIASDLPEMAPLRPGMQLTPASDGRWAVRDGDTTVTEHAWDDLRFSVSWKAYCFADDLRDRGEITDAVPADPTLALLIIDTYIRFPAAAG